MVEDIDSTIKLLADDMSLYVIADKLAENLTLTGKRYTIGHQSGL